MAERRRAAGAARPNKAVKPAASGSASASAKPAAAGATGRATTPASAATAAFFGPPGRVRFVAEGDARAGLRAVTLPKELEPYADPRHPPLRLRAAASARPPRLRLVPDAPPGTYALTVEYEGGRREQVAVTIEPRARLRVVPAALRLAGEPGATVSARLVVENRGNQTVTIDESLVTGLFDDDGIETALAAMYRLETDKLDQIVATGFGRLRAAHGGLLKLRVREGAGELPPRAQRGLLIETQLSSKLPPRHGFHGTLDLGPHTLAIEVSVLDPSKHGARR